MKLIGIEFKLVEFGPDSVPLSPQLPPNLNLSKLPIHLNGEAFYRQLKKLNVYISVLLYIVRGRLGDPHVNSVQCVLVGKLVNSKNSKLSLIKN